MNPWVRRGWTSHAKNDIGQGRNSIQNANRAAKAAPPTPHHRRWFCRARMAVKPSRGPGRGCQTISTGSAGSAAVASDAAGMVAAGEVAAGVAAALTVDVAAGFAAGLAVTP